MDKGQQFIQLVKQYERMSEELGVVREQLNQVMMEIGEENYVQDEQTLAVYKIHIPTGTFVEYKKIGYKRTNLENEKGGGGNVLSKKEAESMGFVLGK